MFLCCHVLEVPLSRALVTFDRYSQVGSESACPMWPVPAAAPDTWWVFWVLWRPPDWQHIPSASTGDRVLVSLPLRPDSQFKPGWTSSVHPADHRTRSVSVSVPLRDCAPCCSLCPSTASPLGSHSLPLFYFFLPQPRFCPSRKTSLTLLETLKPVPLRHLSHCFCYHLVLCPEPLESGESDSFVFVVVLPCLTQCRHTGSPLLFRAGCWHPHPHCHYIDVTWGMTSLCFLWGCPPMSPLLLPFSTFPSTVIY